MTKEFERYLIIFLFLMLLGLGGCVSKQIKIESKEKDAPTTLETIGKMGTIVDVLGCVFDPNACTKANKKLQEELKNGDSK
tara:strand:+ start:345 stop:587 length:243 start_codon:yes stop_codon:yes gene_type:complete